MRATAALGAFVLVVAAFALLAPVSLLDRQIVSATEGRVRLAAASGTVWRGSGIVSDAQGRWRTPIAWRVDAWPLLRGALSVTPLPSESADLRGTVLAEGETLHVTGLHADVPATALESAWKRPPIPRFGGLV